MAKLRKPLEPHASDLSAKVVELALGGDTMALRLCLERLLHTPPFLAGGARQAAPTGLPERAGAGCPGAPPYAARLLQALAHQARLVEIDDLEACVATLEAHRGRS